MIDKIVGYGWIIILFLIWIMLGTLIYELSIDILARIM